MRKSNIKPMIGMILLFSSPRRNGHIDEHIFEKDSIARCRIVDEDVGHRADELTVLNDGRAAHSLNDAARYRQQIGVGDLHGEAF